MEKIPGIDQIPEKAKGMINDKEITRMEAIINSMTPLERKNTGLIKGSRKRRIAKGSGTQLPDVNRLLKQFMQMQKMFKQVSKKRGGMAGLMRGVKNKLPSKMQFPPKMPF